jgi:hypothetical protein
MAEKPAKAAPPALDAAVQSHIGRRLRSMFDEVASQPVPDRFLMLLDELERASSDGDEPDGLERSANATAASPK